MIPRIMLIECVHDVLAETTTVKTISNDDLELLRQFDLNMTFGPCTGEFCIKIILLQLFFFRHSTY